MQTSFEVASGAMWREEHRRMLNAAQIILFLISADFLSSPFHAQEINEAVSMSQRQRAIVIPILLRPVSLAGTPLDLFQPLPHNRKPIVLWKNKDEALAEIADAILPSVINLSRPENISPATDPQLSTSTPASTASPSPVNSQPLGNLESVPPETIIERPSSKVIMEIVDLKLAQFSARESRHRHIWKRRQIIAGVVASITGFFTLFNFFFYSTLPPALEMLLRFLVTLSVLATLFSILLLTDAYSAWRWHYYQQYKADLKNEKKLYQNQHGIYALELDRSRVFEERISQIISNAGVGTKSTDETQDYEQS